MIFSIFFMVPVLYVRCTSGVFYSYTVFISVEFLFQYAYVIFIFTPKFSIDCFQAVSLLLLFFFQRLYTNFLERTKFLFSNFLLFFSFFFFIKGLIRAALYRHLSIFVAKFSVAPLLIVSLLRVLIYCAKRNIFRY